MAKKKLVSATDRRLAERLLNVRAKDLLSAIRKEAEAQKARLKSQMEAEIGVTAAEERFKDFEAQYNKLNLSIKERNANIDHQVDEYRNKLRRKHRIHLAEGKLNEINSNMHKANNERYTLAHKVTRELPEKIREIDASVKKAEASAAVTMDQLRHSIWYDNLPAEMRAIVNNIPKLETLMSGNGTLLLGCDSTGQ